MTDQPPPSSEAPLLRTLSPALLGLERGLRAWLDGPRRYPLSTMTRAALEGMAVDLRRQADALEVDRPLLVVIFMGGTGVGKSSLLNALAGGAIARASFTRPTTRDPVVYYHESVKPDRLDPALRHCRLVPHDRPALAQKILVDTPDLDSNDLSNREKLFHVLPVADVVLYVGSQEKYHDDIGWQLFLQQRRRRAFAFVMNKWDRCVHGAGSGLRPDEDLLRDLKAEGFENPLLFRTCAQAWIDAAAAVGRRRDGAGRPVGAVELAGRRTVRRIASMAGNGPDAAGDRGHQGSRRRAIATASGASRLAAASPPDLTEAATRTRKAWAGPLAEEAAATTEVLLNTLEPYQAEIEHHFTVEGQRRFRGIMGGYLRLVNRSNTSAPASATKCRSCRSRAMGRRRRRRGTPAVSPGRAARSPPTASSTPAARHWRTACWSRPTPQGFALKVLADPVEAASKTDWRQRYALAMSEVLHQVEKQRTEPTGPRRYVQAVLGFLADWVAACRLGMRDRLLPAQGVQRVAARTRARQIGWLDLALPIFVTLAVLVILHVLIALLLPLRWSQIRGEFKSRLEKRLQQELENVYGPVPEDVAALLLAERRQVEKLAGETREVASWLRQREQSASVAGLYGK